MLHLIWGSQSFRAPVTWSCAPSRSWKQIPSRILPGLVLLHLSASEMRAHGDSAGFCGSADIPDQKSSYEWNPNSGDEHPEQQQRGEQVIRWEYRRKDRSGFGGSGLENHRNGHIVEGGSGSSGVRGDRGGNFGRYRGGDAKQQRTAAVEGRHRDGRSRTEEHRYWCSAEKELPTPHDKFVLLSYNILADKNASDHYHDLYHHIPWRLMSWDRRRTKLVQELGLWSPDIMCLQEVDQFEELREEFRRRGYQSTYKGRTGGAVDGCAMFWRTSRFRLLQEESIQFNELNLKDNVAQLCVLESIKAGAEVPTDAEANLLKSGKPANVIIVGNIHVLFNPKRGDIKLGQVRVLLESACTLSEKWKGAPVVIGGDFNSTPTSALYQYLATSELDISCLNRQKLSGQIDAEESNPWKSPTWQGSFHEKSPKAMWTSEDHQTVDASSTQPEGLTMETSTTEAEMDTSTSHLDSTSTSIIEVPAYNGPFSPEALRAESSDGSESQNKSVKRWHWTAEEMMSATGTLECSTVHHRMKLRSAYSEIKGEPGCRDPQGEPLVTTFHKKFMGTVDYIWHTEGLDTVRVLDTLPVRVLQRSQGLPSQKWGSDHLALACEFAFLPRFVSQES